MANPVRGLAPLVLAAALAAGCDGGNSPQTATSTPPVTTPTLPAAGEPTKLLWGDLHLHTAWSFDAFVLATTATPEDAYNFAKGAPLTHPSGGTYQLDRPLDFLAVTDHSEYVGVLNVMAQPGNVLQQTPVAPGLLSTNPQVSGQAFLAMGNAIHAGNKTYFAPQQPAADAAVADAWTKTVQIANRQNDPGKFTALIGYEWTAALGGAEVHRNVVYRGDAAPLPYTSLESNHPEDLWNFLEAQRTAGRPVLAIPHNSNVSNGIMFGTTDSFGRKMTADYIQTRARNEPVVEVTQTKGTSETHPTLSPNDEFAGFELFETFPGQPGPITNFAGGYVRDALKTGLAIQDGDGFNPYRFGVVGGTDSHTAMSPVTESNYSGASGQRDGTAAVRLDCTFCGSGSDFRKYSASGLTAVWASENTRAGVFDAIQRKETYATTGPRIQVRFFGGFGLGGFNLTQSDWVSKAYQTGAPMGGLLGAPQGRTPLFVVWALKDPNGANLDRVQIVKVSSKNGVTREDVFDVVLSDGRTVDPRTGKAPPVGNTVDVAKATYTNTIGAATLSAFWGDPQFDPTARSAYYVRVLEIPTPRWTTFDAVRLNRPPLANFPTSIQERAFTSAIWYDPTGR